MKKDKGFTLVELLVAMTIIAVLAGIALVSFQGTRKSARDGKRKADLEQIRSALEMCYADDNEYPDTIAGSLTCEGGNTYLDSTPTDPVTGDNYYYSAATITYDLCAYLETGGPGNCGSANCGSERTCNYKVTNP